MIKPILLKVDVKGIKIFKDDFFSINFCAVNNVDESSKLFLHNVINNIYYTPVITFVGINASGKTTALNVLSTVTSLHLEEEAISRTWLGNEDITDSLVNDKIIITSYIYFNKKIARICTELSRKNDDIIDLRKNKFIISNEIFQAKSSSNINKSNLFLFDNTSVDISREYLSLNGISFSDDLSIVSYFYSFFEPHEEKYMKIKKDFSSLTRPITFNTSNYNNTSDFIDIRNIDINFAKYLDPSIDILEKIDSNENDNNSYKLKFFHSEKIYKLEINQLSKYLSSGTRRGLILYQFIRMILLCGGFLYIDEIENNLNNTIVSDILKLFYSKNTNPFGAVLIFSTHYSELLDSIKRKDSIYIFEKGYLSDKNECEIFSNKLERNDLKKSEAFLSGSIKKTKAPRNEQFRLIQKSLFNDIKSFKRIFGILDGE